MLKKRILEKGMDLEPLKYYVESFQHGVSPHAGAGIGLERVVFLYLGEHSASVLCCVVLCCIVLCCIVSYSIVLYCIVMYCTVLHFLGHIHNFSLYNRSFQTSFYLPKQYISVLWNGC